MCSVVKDLNTPCNRLSILTLLKCGIDGQRQIGDRTEHPPFRWIRFCLGLMIWVAGGCGLRRGLRYVELVGKELIR